MDRTASPRCVTSNNSAYIALPPFNALRRALTAHARKAVANLNERLLLEIDPDRTLSPEGRARRLAHARKAYFSWLALVRGKGRRGKGG